MTDEIFTDSEGHIIRTSSMKDEHQLVKITEKSPNVQNIGKIVRGDTNSNIITFEINRYYDGVDLYEKNIRLIVKNGNDIFVETAANLQYSDTLLRFSWILSRSVTYKTGSVMAVIEFYSETDSKLDYSLKTIPFKINIEDSLDVSDITGIGEGTSISVSPVPVASVTKSDGVSIFTVTDKDGTTSVEILDGVDGRDGIGISKIEKIGTVDLVDTYRITFTDNSTFDYEITNGKDGTGGEGASTWSEISGKPFETLSTDFSVENGELKVVGCTGGSGEENVIESIKVNGVAQTVAADKSVDITVPDTYDDTSLVQRVSNIESDYAKSSDIPSLSGYATEDYVTEKISNIPSVDLTDYAKKDEIPDVSGYITEEQFLAKDYADKAYVTEEIAKVSTGGKIDLSSYLSKVEATETYVAKESGKSLITDTEIERLASVDNYDDTQVNLDITALSNRVKTIEDEFQSATDGEIDNMFA